jgi:type IV secretory pathway VirB4 component
LVKQGAQSAIAKMDLDGLGDYIAVFAMAADEFPLLEEAKAIAGGNPDAWIPVYRSLRQARSRKLTRFGVQPLAEGEEVAV